MERDKSNHLRNQDDSQRWPDSDAAESHATSHKDEHIAINKDVSGNDIEEEQRDETRRHQAFGNRSYHVNSNHSSADDQPMTDTGA